MIDVWLVAWLVVGVVLVWTAERRRRGRLLRRVAIELEGVEAVVERRRALLARLAQELPQVVPVCHGALDQLGRAQRASADAAEAWRGRPGDPGAAGELRAPAGGRQPTFVDSCLDGCECWVDNWHSRTCKHVNYVCKLRTRCTPAKCILNKQPKLCRSTLQRNRKTRMR